MKYKRISFGQGKGSITHNNRTFIANNVDKNRITDNITFISRPINEVYDELFGDAVECYNARQKRNDRKIHDTYYEHLFHCKPSNSVITASDKRKSFYEDVVQIGKMEDSGYGTEDFQLVADCLTEYMNGFQARNPNFHVFNAVLHMDEATPHLHIDYIPIGHYKRGMDTQNGIAQALKEMCYGEGKQAIARWREKEVDVLNEICRSHGIEQLPPEKARGTLEVSEYKEQRRKAEQLAVENEKSQSELDALNDELKSATEKKVKIVEIDSIETKKSRFSKNKISISEEDFQNLSNLAKKQVAGVKQNKNLFS
ncbi:MAG: plasmid recombination protein [Ruminococcus sp.]|nr:plasmid recombination protein [Ruminococcus sp.]